MKIVKSGLIPFLVIFIIIAVFSGCDEEGWNSKKILPPPGTKARVKVQVNVVKVRRGDICSPIMATGTILPQEESRVGAKISGRIEKIFVDEGDEFEKGDILGRLGQKDFLIVEKRVKAELAVARASLREAELHLGNLSREKRGWPVFMRERSYHSRNMMTSIHPAGWRLPGSILPLPGYWKLMRIFPWRSSNSEIRSSGHPFQGSLPKNSQMKLKLFHL